MTTPSVVFSTGTTPSCTLARLDRREHVARWSGRAHELRERAELLARRLVRERALGPEVGDLRPRSSSERVAEMISRNTGAMPASGNGPGFCARERVDDPRSRDGS